MRQASRWLTWLLLCGLAPAQALWLKSGDLALELGEAGRVSSLALAGRPATTRGPGGWDVLYHHAHVDQSVACPPTRWRLGDGWQLLSAGVAQVSLGDERNSGPLRLLFPFEPDPHGEVSFTVHVALRRTGFTGRVRAGLMALNALGQAASDWVPLAPPTDESGPFGDWVGHLLPLPGATTLAVQVAAEDGTGALACGGATITLQRPEQLEPAGLLGSVRATADGARFEAEDDRLSLAVDYRTGDGGLRVDARAVAKGTGDQALSLFFSLPLDASGWDWWDSTTTRETVAATGVRTYGNWRQFANAQAFSPWPLGCVTRAAPAGGLALLAPPDQRVLTRFGYRPERGLFAVFDLALAPSLGHPSAALQLSATATEPRWGLRGALARWYALYRPSFDRRDSHDGAWFTACDPDAIGDPARWGLMFDEQARMHLEWTRSQRLVALELVSPWADESAAERVLTTGLGEGATAVDGLWLDGLAATRTGWHAATLDAARLRASPSVLSFERASGRPCELAAVRRAAWLADAARRAAAGKLLCGTLDDSLPLPWLAPPLDVFGGGENLPSVDHLLWLRALAYHKPLTYLSAEQTDPAPAPGALSELWQRSVLTGAFPGAAGWFNRARLAGRERAAANIRLLQRLSTAGWEPVPYAELADDRLQLERFGRGANCHLVVRNGGPTARTTVLTIWPRPLELTERRLVDLYAAGGAVLEPQPLFDRWQLTLTVPPGRCLVLAPAGAER